MSSRRAGRIRSSPAITPLQRELQEVAPTADLLRPPGRGKQFMSVMLRELGGPAQPRSERSRDRIRLIRNIIVPPSAARAENVTTPGRRKMKFATREGV